MRMENDFVVPWQRKGGLKHHTITTIICFLDVVVIFIAIDFPFFICILFAAAVYAICECDGD